MTEDYSVGWVYLTCSHIICDSMVCAYGSIIHVEHHFFMVWPIHLWGQDDFVNSVHLGHIQWKTDICVCADCGGTWQVLERVIISLGDKLYRLSLAKLLCVNKSWPREQLLVFVQKWRKFNSEIQVVFCIVSLNTEAVIELLVYGKPAFARNLKSVLPFYWTLKWGPQLLSRHCIFWKYVLALDGAPVLKYEQFFYESCL